MSRRVSVYEYAHEWVWRHSAAKGPAKFVLLAICRAMAWTPRGYETRPLPVKEIAESTGYVESTVRENLDRLAKESGDLEVIKSARRGETYRYRLQREPLLPLADIRPRDPQRRESAVTPPRIGGDDTTAPAPPIGGDTAANQRSHRRGSAPSAPEFGGGAAGGVLLSEDVLVPSTSTTEEDAAAAAFLAWFGEEYRQRRGVVYRPANAAKATEDIRTLLRTYGPDPLRAMARAMWADTADPWLNDRQKPNDRSVFSLRQKASYLEGLVKAAASPTRNVLATILERVEVRVDRRAYHTWFAPLRLADDRGDVLVLDAPSQLHVDWIRKHLRDPLHAAVEDVRPGAAVEFRIAEQEAAG